MTFFLFLLTSWTFSTLSICTLLPSCHVAVLVLHTQHANDAIYLWAALSAEAEISVYGSLSCRTGHPSPPWDLLPQRILTLTLTQTLNLIHPHTKKWLMQVIKNCCGPRTMILWILQWIVIRFRNNNYIIVECMLLECSRMTLEAAVALTYKSNILYTSVSSGLKAF